MEVESCVPPGFRFHPTEEELVGYYLRRKVASQKIDLEVITDIDLYRIEPWDLQERCKHGYYEEQTEWYFFSHKDKKYPSGTRTNRATAAGFWKATGRDKAVLSKAKLIGMRKTLVFYKGRAPNGRKTDWIMHEYRLESSEHGPPQEEGWVVCRAFKKQIPNQQRPYLMNTYNIPPYNMRHHHDEFGFEAFADPARPPTLLDSYNPRGNPIYSCQMPFGFGGEHESSNKQANMINHLLDIPDLGSPSLSSSLATKECFDANAVSNEEHSSQITNNGGREQFIDWKVLDKLLASQLSESAAGSNSNEPMFPVDFNGDARNQGANFLNSFDV